MPYFLKRILFTIPFLTGLSTPYGFSVETIEVDLTDSIRPVSHCASGALYGITETLPEDINVFVAPLKPHVYCLPPSGKDGNQHNFGDGFVVAERLRGTDAKVQFLMADLLPYWPYQWSGQKKWLAMVEDVLKKHKDSGLDNIHSYVIWNEVNETWQDSNGDFNTVLWKPTYDLIRKYFPDIKIVGPASSFYSRDLFKEFFNFCIENNCMPDLVCWHQWGSESFAAAAEDYRELTKELGMPNLPLCINEYSAGFNDNQRKLEGCPGYSVPFIAKFERNNVESATISWWFTGLPGRLGSLLTADNEPGGGWWLYKWYGDMTGYMAMVTPPNDYSDGLDGFAAVNRKHNYASIVVGGNYKGNAEVYFSKWPNFLNGKIKVTVERVTWEDKDLPVTSTQLISEEVMDIYGPDFTLPILIENPLYAYRIQFSAVDIPQTTFNGIAATIPGIIEAENYDVGGEGFSYHDNEDENRGSEYRDDCVDIVKSDDGYALGYTEFGEWTEYTVNVQESSLYDITAKVSNGGDLDGFRLYIDDEEVTNDYVIPKTGDNWTVYQELPIATVAIDKGTHLVRIVINGSYVNIDWLKFEKNKESSAPVVYNDIKTIKDARFYDLEGRKVKANKLKTGKVYIAVIPNKGELKFILK